MVDEQISTKVVVILLAITIVITLVGTWLILTTITSGDLKGPYEAKDKASVSLTLVEPPTEDTGIIEEGGS